MIVLIIGVIVIVFTLLAIAVTQFSDRDEIEQKREVANMAQNERVKEDLIARYNEPTDEVSKPSINVTNNWGEESKLTGYMVICDDDKEYTRFFNAEIPASGISFPDLYENATELCR